MVDLSCLNADLIADIYYSQIISGVLMTSIYSLTATKNRLVQVVAISDAKISSDPGVTLVTYALGSCVAVSLWDSSSKIGGLWHFLCPFAPTNYDNPLKYADAGIDLFLDQFNKKGGNVGKAQVKLIGGARILTSSNSDIGADNVNEITRLLKQRRINIRACSTGQTNSRTAMLRIDDGTITIRSKKMITQI